jgi:hypothetical protein
MYSITQPVYGNPTVDCYHYWDCHNHYWDTLGITPYIVLTNQQGYGGFLNRNTPKSSKFFDLGIAHDLGNLHLPSGHHHVIAG